MISFTKKQGHGSFFGFLFSASLIFGGAPAIAAGLIVNEASNGTSGAKEFYEFIVVGDAGNPTGNVNLDGWILDDNNGEWEGSSSGVGIAPGYARFDATTNPIACSGLSSIAPGSIILVYNDGDPNANLPPDDASDTNGDGVYVLQARGACIKTCAGPPTTSNISYSVCATAATPSYSPLAMRNSGDVAQSRDSSGTLFHGFTYGDVTAPYPAGSFRVGSASGSGTTFIFSCGSWYIGGNFSRVSASVDTPGAANNTANTIFRQRISSGNFNYTNLSDTANCIASPIISIQKSSAVVNDPVNLSTNPKAIPGAVREYCILISNMGFLNAESVIATDTIPTDISYTPGTMLSGISCNSALDPEDDNNIGADENDPWGASISGSTITLIANILEPADTLALTYQATID
ncbi:MAG: hypothetical protein ABJN65_10215 [Parasphingorhabdus sp.]